MKKIVMTGGGTAGDLRLSGPGEGCGLLHPRCQCGPVYGPGTGLPALHSPGLRGDAEALRRLLPWQAGSGHRAEPGGGPAAGHAAAGAGRNSDHLP